MGKVEKLELEATKGIIGGKYYGNGVSCGKYTCTVDWGKAIGIIGNNSAANVTTGGAAGWKS